MKNSYKSLKSGDKFQDTQNIHDTKMEDKAKGTLEKPFGGKGERLGVAHKAMDSVKYAPKTVSFAEFTDAKRNAKFQAMSKGGSDYEAKGKMEDMHTSELPHAKKQKSFDIDPTDYKPRKARG